MTFNSTDIEVFQHRTHLRQAFAVENFEILSCECPVELVFGCYVASKNRGITLKSAAATWRTSDRARKEAV